MDVVLSDVPFAKGDVSDLKDVVLSTYRTILDGSGARGYSGGLYNPGTLYSEMRKEPAFVMVDKDVRPAWRPYPEETITHLSPPDWQRTLQRRRGERAHGALDDGNGSADCMLVSYPHGSLVAMRADAPLSVPILHVRRTAEDEMEAQKRRARRIVQARESVMRLRAAGDDGAGIGMLPINQWSGSGNDQPS
jgi:hypothetical protein